MIKNLVISGGSTKTIAAVGGLRYLEEHHLISSVSTYVGASAGSILCLFLVLGYSVAEIVDTLKDQMTLGLLDLEFDELLSFTTYTSCGLDSGSNIMVVLRNVLFKKTGKTDMTFLELVKATGKNIVVCVANLTTQNQEYIDVEAQPNMSVLKAIRMSISLPFIFTPVEHNGCLYVDGALYESLPVGYIKRFNDPLKDTLALNTRTVIDPTVNNIIDFTNVLMNSLIEKLNDENDVSSKIKILEVVFDESEASPIDIENLRFDIDEENMKMRLEKGYDAVKQYFQEQKP